MSSFFTDLKESLRRPEFWMFSSWLDIITRYRRTRLGLLWIVIPTAVFVAAIGQVYSIVMGHDPEFYLPYLAIGYLLFRFMTQCLSESGSILRTHKSFIMDGRVRMTDYVLRSIAKAFFIFVCSFVVIIVTMAWSPMTSLVSLFTILLTFPLVMLNSFWLSSCMSMIGARHVDSAEMVTTLMRFGMLLTPILWVGDRFSPGTFGWWAVHLNPAYHLITVVRNPLLGQPIPSESLWFVLIMTVLGWGLTALVYRRYARFVPLWI
ncbi:ABC transporter permease [Luteimonas sp. MJ293]|uniref:ABC transporter permease n=1 Tax=Luteimonas sp. MJ146 TaxID=3129240 RepID=UPI0031BB41F3